MNLDHYPIWDQDALMGRMRGKSERVAKLASLFLDDIPGRIQDLAQEASNLNAKECAMQAHTVKGVAANLSVIRLEEIAKQIETAAKNQHIDQVAALIDDINEIYTASENELKKFIDAHS